MIDSYTATSVLIGFLLIFGVLLPILDKLPKVRDVISFRWTIVVIYSALCIGVIIDFEHLDTSVRFAVVIGGIILSALFLLVRSLEKAAVNRWKFPRMRGKVQKGNINAELSVNPKLDSSTFPSQPQSQVLDNLPTPKDPSKESSRQEEISNVVMKNQVESKYDEEDDVLNQALFDIKNQVKKEKV